MINKSIYLAACVLIQAIAPAFAALDIVQYARRFYEIDGSAAKILIAARKKIVPQLAVLGIPN